MLSDQAYDIQEQCRASDLQQYVLRITQQPWFLIIF